MILKDTWNKSVFEGTTVIEMTQSIRDIRPCEANTTQLPSLLDLFHWRMQWKLLGDHLTISVSERGALLPVERS